MTRTRTPPLPSGEGGIIRQSGLAGPQGTVKECERRSRKIALFGHFDSSNFGNESTLQAILYHLRRFDPDAEVTCISTGYAATATTHHVDALPIADVFFESWVPRNRLSKAL